jgi:hypothetical protein
MRGVRKKIEPCRVHVKPGPLDLQAGLAVPEYHHTIF